MSYDQEQKSQQVTFFGAEKGGGNFGGKVYDFALSEPYRLENLYPPLQEAMRAYYSQTPIKWWRGEQGEPTNLMIATQIACLNHLYWLNNEPAAATALVQRFLPDRQAVPFSSGRLVEFDYNGCDVAHTTHPLGEKSTDRGMGSTCLSAAILAENSDGKRELLVIEWRYCEKYYQKAAAMDDDDPLYVSRRAKMKDLLTAEDCPVFLERGMDQQAVDYDAAFQKFSVEPFYTTLLETLLAWQLTKQNIEATNGWHYIQVIPQDNTLLLHGETSKAITSGFDDITVGWRSYLREPKRYTYCDPRQLIESLAREFAPEIADYLSKRYWQTK